MRSAPAGQAFPIVAPASDASAVTPFFSPRPLRNLGPSRERRKDLAVTQHFRAAGERQARDVIAIDLTRDAILWP